MSLIPRSLLISATPFFLASAAAAELTAKDVWNDWQRYTAGLGSRFQATENETSDGLTLTGVTFVSQAADGAGGLTVFMDQIVMTETSDGAVTVTLPAIMPIELSTLDPEGKNLRISADYRQTGMNIVASGTRDSMRYTYDAQEIKIATTGFEKDGQPFASDNISFEMVMESIEGETNVTAAETISYDQDLHTAALSYAFAFEIPDTQEAADIRGQYQSVSFEGQSILPKDVANPEDMEEMLRAGFSTDGVFAFQDNATSVATKSPGDTTDMSIISDNGQLGVSLDTSGLTYEGSQENLKVSASSDQIPIPIEFGTARAAFNFAMPVIESEQFGDFAFGLEFSDFSLSDLVWGMFDPGAQLPRDPATLVLDLTGKTRLLFDFLDPTTVPTLSPGQMPAELERLDINALQLDVAGAELTGDGAFTFENSDFGPPKPIGAVNLTLVGGNTLINQLVAMGLLPEDQAMGMRMMMGLLAVPGETPDTLNSRIEINDQGHILANGQRIQ